LHQPSNDASVSASLLPQVLAALDRIQGVEGSTLTDLARVTQIALHRMGPPDVETQRRLIARFDALFPADRPDQNAVLGELLVYLQSPDAAEKLVQLLTAAPTQEEQIEYARSLRMLKAGWTPALQQTYFEWFHKAAGYRGGASFGLFVQNIKKDALAQLTEADRATLAGIIDAPLDKEAHPAVAPPRPLVKEWKLDDLVDATQAGLKRRDFERGKAMFAAANCFACHRYDNQGGALGPDLTSAAGRFSPRDLLESIVDPGKVISDQYAAVTIVTEDGKSVTGRIVNLNGDTMKISTNMLDPDEQTSIDRRQIEEMFPSKTSMMPNGLLNTLQQDEVLDLMAYLLSRGDKSSAMFK
jgi:putative heme-binding domain-containing protein